MRLPYREHPYLWFLLSLASLLLLSPFFEEEEEGRRGGVIFLGLLITGVLVAGMRASCTTRKRSIIGGVLACLTLLAIWIAPFLRGALLGEPDSPSFALSAFRILAASPALFYFYVAAITLGFVLRDKRVTGERIAAAMCVYLLFGYGFSSLYALMEGLAPGSLVSAQDPELRWSEFVFYSFVTMTTLGYGDITPVSGSARSLAVFQTIMAVFYLAVLIARLVASYEHQERATDTDS